FFFSLSRSHRLLLSFPTRRSSDLPFRDMLCAHCGICGNLELQRIAAEHVPGQASVIGRLLGLPAFRCVPCRNKFFSVRPLRRERSEEHTSELQSRGHLVCRLLLEK